jgi:peptidylprolyl isomerase
MIRSPDCEVKLNIDNWIWLLYLLVIVPLVLIVSLSSVKADAPLTTQGVLDAASDADWRRPEPQNLLYLQLKTGLVVFELAPMFAPGHIDNIRRLVATRYFDGLPIIRAQDNYVVQWADPAVGTDKAKSLGEALSELEPEFFRSSAGLNISKLDSRDAYADRVGFVDGFPVATDEERAWLTHCYGILGVGRETAANSGNGAEMYVVIGHSPRHLDRNVTLIGRVLSGIEHLSILPRGTEVLGMYETEEEYVEIVSIRFGDEIVENERLKLEVLRSDTQTFKRYLKTRTFRRHEWFVDPAGRIELCNVHIPVRKVQWN